PGRRNEAQRANRRGAHPLDGRGVGCRHEDLKRQDGRSVERIRKHLTTSDNVSCLARRDDVHLDRDRSADQDSMRDRALPAGQRAQRERYYEYNREEFFHGSAFSSSDLAKARSVTERIILCPQCSRGPNVAQPKKLKNGEAQLKIGEQAA